MKIIRTILLVCLLFFSLINSLQATSLQQAASSEPRYGAHMDDKEWAHFVVHAPSATKVNLLLFEKAQDKSPTHTIAMIKRNDDWTIKIKGVVASHGLMYMYQADGPNEVSADNQFGAMFNPNIYLSDPYAYEMQNVRYSSVFSATPYTDIKTEIYAGGGKSVLYDHTKDSKPTHVEIPYEDLIIYELHVQDYTARLKSLDKNLRGTYLGLGKSGLKTPGNLTAGIDHLVELGVTAVELMPVMEYDEETGNVADRYNHWGYMTSNFFAPEVRYASELENSVIELKQLIQAFHDKDIAVLMDVVYNHTAEQGPWVDGGRLAAKRFNLMGLTPVSVYRSTNDKRYFYNNTGTGNDVSFYGDDKRFTKQLVCDSLSLWYEEYGVDGFRFDLARILSDGSFSAADWVDNDTRFTKAHLHAEPWDMGGQWWSFMDSAGWSYRNNRWAKWLGKYRDKARKFSKSALLDQRMLKQLIEGYGSVSDGYGAVASTQPWRSINMLAIHDGYTLRDTTYFNDDDPSHNCWDSGRDENVRRERSKLMMGLLLTSQGVPIILQGDEFGRSKAAAKSQSDAHNTYNYESSNGDLSINNVNWIDWRLKDGDNVDSPKAPTYGRELFNWTKGLISLRKQWSHFRNKEFVNYVSGIANDKNGKKNDGKFTYIWETQEVGCPTQLAVIWWGKESEPDLMVIYNEHWDSFKLNTLREWSNGDWKIAARSWYGDDADFVDLATWEQNAPDAGKNIEVKGLSLTILLSDND
jgi:glycogen operon protein